MSLVANVSLEFNAVTKKARVVDNTDYSSLGPSFLSGYNAKGLGNVTSPTGSVIFNGSSVGNPLVDLEVSINGQWFDLPLDSNGEILNGTYSFTYNLNYSYNSATGGSALFSIVAPSTIRIDFDFTEILQAGDAVVTTGNGNAANNGTFTIASLSYDSGNDTTGLVVTATTLVNDNTPAGNYSFNVTRTNFAGDTITWNGCNFVTPKVVVNFDCDSTQFGQIIFQDTTVTTGQTIVSRTLTAFYPNGLTPAPVTPSVSTTTSSLTVNELATGTWTYSLTLNMSVTQADGLIYTYTVNNTDEIKVSCVGSLCSLTPCLETFKDKLLAGYKNGQSANLFPTAITINNLMALAQEYKSCGETEKYAETFLELQSVLDTTGDCNCGCCEEDVPMWINNAGFSSQTLLEELLDDVTALQALSVNQAVTRFQSRQVYGSDLGYDNTPLAFSNLSAIAISSDLFDYPTVDGAFGQKYVEIEINAEGNASGAEVAVRITPTGSPITVFQEIFSTGTMNVKMILCMQKSGSNMLLWCTSTRRVINSSNEIVSATLNTTSTNPFSAGQNLTLNLVPITSGSQPKTAYTYVKITSFGSQV